MPPSAEPPTSNGAHGNTSGTNQVNGTGDANGTNSTRPQYTYPPPPPAPETPYTIPQQHHSRPSLLRIACIGAGASGLCLSYKLAKTLPANSYELTIYEKNPHYGGTWYENTYPGIACDIPSHNYSFTFDPKPDWKSFFAEGEEIQGYFEGFARRYGVLDRGEILVERRVVEGRWDEGRGVWGL